MYVEEQLDGGRENGNEICDEDEAGRDDVVEGRQYTADDEAERRERGDSTAMEEQRGRRCETTDYKPRGV